MRLDLDREELLDRLSSIGFETKVAACTAVVALVAILAAFFVSHGRAAADDRATAAIDAQVVQLNVPISEGRDVLHQKSRVIGDIKALSTATPDQAEITTIISTVFSLAGKYQLAIPGATQSIPTGSAATGGTGEGPSATAVSGGIEISVTLTGSLGGVEHFVDQLRREPRIMTLDQLSLTFSQGKATAPLVLTAYTGPSSPRLR